METKVTNYAWFYSLLNEMPGNQDKEELKAQLVWQFSNLRTESLKELTSKEYFNMCNHMQFEANKEKDKKPKAPLSIEQLEMKQARSSVLKRIQQLGIDTTDFGNVDNFCLNKKIAGKVFRKLTFDELKSLVPKLEAIIYKDKASATTRVNKIRLN